MLKTPSTGYEKRILAAEGYIELGMPLDANAELEEIDPERRDATAVLALRVRIYSRLEKWELMRAVAKVLAQRDPDNVQWTVSWASATRRADCLDAARLILVNAVERRPDANRTGCRNPRKVPRLLRTPTLTCAAP